MPSLLPTRPVRRLVGPALALALVSSLHASILVLDDPASPVRAEFDTATGRLTVVQKSDGFTWKNTSTGGGDAITVGSATQVDATNVTAAITHPASGASLTLALALDPASGDLRVTLGGASALVPNGVQYPYAFHGVGQGNTGLAVLPFDSGFVLPEAQTTYVTKFSPLSNRRMEWFGGVDASNARGWIGILESYADVELKTSTGTHEGASVIGGMPRWVGSNANPSHTTNLLSYDRVVRFQFVPSGGYVALAKRFRAWAATQGWLKTLAQKNAEDPDHKTDKLMGAPVIYLWGDGRDEALVDELYAAGLRNAVLQVSVNHVDQNANFPNTAHADGPGWMDAVRAKGFLPGFYDIYQGLRIGGSTPAYDGTRYLWPTSQAAAWAYYDSAGNPDVSTQGTISMYSIAAQKQMEFAVATRLPAHLAQFGVDAYFFDTTAAGPPREDYDTANGHFATRAMDIVNRIGLIDAAYSNPLKRLVVGTEQGRSWTVPVVHWGEGKFWLGETGNLTNADAGTWNNVTYPAIMVNVVDPTTLSTNKLGPLLSHGWQAPLWDLVFHDCMVNTAHWHQPHDKFLYAWDHADRWALLRGQSALLNMTRTGAQGSATVAPNTITDTHGVAWSTRWTTMQSRFVQTFDTVCAWHRRVGYLEMIGHEWLTSDRTVQASEFSSDGGVTGHGIVVNFGSYDGAFGHTGPTWNGTRRGQSLSVPVASYRTYAWAPMPPGTAFCSGDGSGAACPCGNAGASGNGCASSVFASGANLSATGVQSVAEDSLALLGANVPNSTALYFQGTGEAAGGLGTLLGDGLLCLDGALLRLGTKTIAGNVSRYPEAGDASVSVRGQVPSAGATRTYQLWYRNAASFCTSATYNLSNGLRVTWVP
ncbi:MAG: hypothetical protein HZA53_17640 [Planctomycetes bacterium]|nr:hypothetical protein [Planctomycetota bacterium]